MGRFTFFCRHSLSILRSELILFSVCFSFNYESEFSIRSNILGIVVSLYNFMKKTIHFLTIFFFFISKSINAFTHHLATSYNTIQLTIMSNQCLWAFMLYHCRFFSLFTHLKKNPTSRLEIRPTCINTWFDCICKKNWW